MRSPRRTTAWSSTSSTRMRASARLRHRDWWRRSRRLVVRVRHGGRPSPATRRPACAARHAVIESRTAAASGSELHQVLRLAGLGHERQRAAAQCRTSRRRPSPLIATMRDGRPARDAAPPRSASPHLDLGQARVDEHDVHRRRARACSRAPRRRRAAAPDELDALARSDQAAARLWRTRRSASTTSTRTERRRAGRRAAVVSIAAAAHRRIAPDAATSST